MKKNKYSTPLWMLATILAGMLSPMQSAVNGQLGHWLQDGNACAVISFASGLVVMFFIIMARKETRQQFAAIPSLIKNRKVPLWNWFAGLCGAMVVFSEGASASALGVATFQTALISALLLSGLLCDRFGIGVDEKKYFTLMNPLMILVKIIKLRWIHILSYDQMVSRKINNQTTRCANSIFYTTLFTNSAPNYT
ncbi:DMT family transporter [Escherichia coli]